jgi:hypothetical protein
VALPIHPVTVPFSAEIVIESGKLPVAIAEKLKLRIKASL